MKKTSKKGLVLLVALALLVGVTAGSTLAWLLDTTKPVVNTFTTSNVDIELAETKENFQMIPGYTIEKDPVVTVKANSEKCYVFVKVEKSESFDTYMTYDMAEGWTELTENTGVYYRIVEKKTTEDQSFAVIKNDTVNVKAEVTNAMMEIAKTTKPTLTVTAYACQYNKDNTNAFGVEAAWDSVKNLGATDAYTPTTPTP